MKHRIPVLSDHLVKVPWLGKRKCTCFMSKFIDYEEMIEMPNLMKYGLVVEFDISFYNEEK